MIWMQLERCQVQYPVYSIKLDASDFRGQNGTLFPCIEHYKQVAMLASPFHVSLHSKIHKPR